MIRVENVSFKYPEGNEILKNLDFHIKKGEFTAIIGRNGAGKTTLLKHFNGLLKPVSGKVLINGIDTRRAKTSELARHIGFLFQNPDHQIFCSTVYEEIAFGLKKTGRIQSEIDKQVCNAAEITGMAAYLQFQPFTLSKGQRQRVALASLLAMDTEVLVLDEPTTGQDYREGIEIMDIIRNLNAQGKTIVMVTHDMELVAEYARRVIVLNNGTAVADDTAYKILSDSELLSFSSLDSPQIFQLAARFAGKGLFKDVSTPEEFYREIFKLLKRDGGAAIVGNS